MFQQKKIMLLGGIHYLLPAIEAAHKQGYYVITADYLPDNIAHKHSDEYVNVSIVDKDAVLSVAREKQIDGILSFAVDPGVVTAAYVQEQMGLPTMGPYESVRILQNKDLFRQFLNDNGFNVPFSKGYGSVEEALRDTDWLTYPIMVKPTDSAGSKGVTRVNQSEDYEKALHVALSASISGNIIVEQFIELHGFQSGSDSFSINGQMAFTTFDDQLFDPHSINPYTPAAHIWPSSMDRVHQTELATEIQRLVSLLGMKTTMYNIESRVGKDGKPYIMELSPRAGGNRLAEVIRMATGVDMITAQVRTAVGDSIEPIEPKPFDGHWAEIVLHSPQDGIFNGIKISDEYAKNVKELELRVKNGDTVRAFRGANDSIGTLILKFSDREKLNYALSHQSEWLHIALQQ